MADVELLPLPSVLLNWPHTTNHAAIRAYARANLAPLQAEIERLRDEVERLTFEMGCLQQQYDERTAYMIIHRGAALACSDSVRAAYSDEHHRAERLRAEVAEWKRVAAAQAELHGEAKACADRLAEALRDALEYLKHHLPDDMLEMHRAALAQEDRNG